jgi:hypothetical protein
VDEVDDVVADLGRDLDVGGVVDHRPHDVRVDHRAEVLDGELHGVVEHHFELRVAAHVAHRQLEQEPVELGLGQRERAGQLHRVLRGQHQERAGQVAGDTVDRHPPLGHGLQQRRLRLRGGPVDLVRQEDVGEDRPRPELERALLLVEDRRPGDVAGEHVGRALHPVRGGVDRLGDGPGQHRLAGAGHVLEEDVALAQDGDERQAHDLGLALDDCLDVLDDGLEGGRERHGVDRLGRVVKRPPLSVRGGVDPALHRHGNGRPRRTGQMV